ncbi:MAG: tetratricopeptide repeat protein [Anaerolineaceae bacterium]
MSSWKIRLFGGLAIERDGEIVLRLRTRKDDLLLAYLALSASTTHVRKTVAADLWPSSESAKARKILSFNQFSLKKRLAEIGLDEVLVETRTTLRLAPGIATDVQEFVELVQKATALPATEADERSRLFGQAVALYGDGLLPSYSPPWLDTHRARLERMYQQAVTERDPARAIAMPAYHGEHTSLAGGGDIRARGVTVRPLGAEEAEIASPTWGRPDGGDELRRLAEQIAEWEEILASPDRWSAIEEVDGLYETRLRELLSRPPRRWTIEPIVSIAASLWRYWYLKAQYAEGATTIDRLMASGLPITLATRAKALHASGTLAYFNGDPERAVLRLREAMPLWHSLGDNEGLLRTLVNFGMAQYGLQEHEQALALYEQAIAIAERQGNNIFLSTALFNASLSALHLENTAMARELLGRRLALGSSVLDISDRAATHIQMAAAALVDDDDREARRQAETAWDLLREGEDLRGRSVVLSLLGRCAQRAGELDQAMGMYQQALDEAKLSGDVGLRAEALGYLAVAHAARGEKVEADRKAERTRQLYRIAGTAEQQRRFERDLAQTRRGS